MCVARGGAIGYKVMGRIWRLLDWMAVMVVRRKQKGECKVVIKVRTDG